MRNKFILFGLVFLVLIIIYSSAVLAVTPTISFLVVTPGAISNISAGRIASIDVTFSQNVNVVGGPPKLELTVALNTRANATYSHGSGSQFLTFNYTVQAGDNFKPVNTSGNVNPAPLQLNGGTIKNAGLENADLALPGPFNDLGSQQNPPLIFDTAPPSPTWLTPTNSGNFTNSIYNITFNASISELNFVYGVRFSFDNASGTNFNVTAVNRSGHWSTQYNISSLAEGTHTVTVIANDSSGNWNNTQLITFITDNTAPTATWVTPTNVSNYTRSSYNITFNASIAELNFAQSVLFSFDNASGTNFNITAVNGSGRWAVQYNVSSLAEGTHIVTVIANDSVGNLVNTQQISFIVDNTAPTATWVTPTNVSNYTRSSYNITFNASISELNFAQSVLFSFDNASGTNFNITAVNGSGRWAVQYNVSSLAEGTHIVTVIVNDSMGNWNNTQQISFTVDYTTPVITVSCGDGSFTAGETVTCSCSATEGNYIASGPYFSGTTSSSESTTASGSGSFTSSICSATDSAGNVGTGTGSWSVAAASTGGGGGGGSGGGVSAGVSGQFAKEVWTSIKTGETATIEVTNGAIGVTEVNFDVTETVAGAWIKVEKKESLPSEVQSFNGKVYKNIEITQSKVETALSGTATINFKVNKAWLGEQGLGKTDVAMHRYAEGKWNELKTTVGEDDGTYQHYSAETPGFSYFVIGQKKVVPTMKKLIATTTETEEGTNLVLEPAEIIPETAAETETAGKILQWDISRRAMIQIGIALIILIILIGITSLILGRFQLKSKKKK